ncbi:hypothetical protein [Mesobacillus harenae]|nr:hypothetical protein [Mesobacillus harenae]
MSSNDNSSEKRKTSNDCNEIASEQRNRKDTKLNSEKVRYEHADDIYK